MNYDTLATLIQTHPQWPTVTDVDLKIWVNAEVISATKTELPNEKILSVILSNRAEFSALSAGDQQIVRDILYIGDSVPTAAGEPARDTLVSIFGAGSQTIQALAAAITYQISRLASVGILGVASTGDIEEARRRVI